MRVGVYVYKVLPSGDLEIINPKAAPLSGIGVGAGAAQIMAELRTLNPGVAFGVLEVKISDETRVKMTGRIEGTGMDGRPTAFSLEMEL